MVVTIITKPDFHTYVHLNIMHLNIILQMLPLKNALAIIFPKHDSAVDAMMTQTVYHIKYVLLHRK